VHNTQPWRFVLTGDALEIRADASRQLTVLDPRGRQMLISLGCALFHARVAIQAAGFEPVVSRFPDLRRPTVVAKVGVGRPVEAGRAASLDRAIDRRRTNRRAFMGDPVPPRLVAELRYLARAEGAVLVSIEGARDRATVTGLAAEADRLERNDPLYLDELARWTTDDPRRPDGVQAAGVPFQPDPTAPAPDPLPIRGFDLRHMGWLPTASGSDGEQCLLLFCTHEDNPRGWLRTGEALEHAWLELTDRGFWASPLTQVVEVSRTNSALQTELRLGAYPQVLLRVGRAPETPPTRRRAPNDVIRYVEP
jgi:nitroreductase